MVPSWTVKALSVENKSPWSCVPNCIVRSRRRSLKASPPELPDLTRVAICAQKNGTAMIFVDEVRDVSVHGSFPAKNPAVGLRELHV